MSAAGEPLPGLEAGHNAAQAAAAPRRQMHAQSRTWTPGRGDCADCWRDQAAAYAAGRPVPLRQRARLRHTAPEGATVLVCTAHALRRGWRGRA